MVSNECPDCSFSFQLFVSLQQLSISGAPDSYLCILLNQDSRFHNLHKWGRSGRFPQSTIFRTNSLRPILGIGYKIGSIFLFVIMMAMVKFLHEKVPLGQTIFFRALIGLGAVVLVYSLRGEFRQTFRIVSVKKHLGWALSCACAMVLWFTALTLIPLPEATAIGFVVPLITVALAWMLLGERVRFFRWIAVLVGLLGVGIIIWPRLGLGADYGSKAAFGAALALGAASLWALAQVFLRRLSKTETSGSAVMSFSVATMVLGFVTIFNGWSIPSAIEWAAIVLCGLAGGFGQLCIAQSLRYGEASTMAPFEYLTFPVASIVGALAFNEYPHDNVWLGLPLVVAAGLFVIYRERRLSRLGDSARVPGVSNESA